MQQESRTTRAQWMTLIAAFLGWMFDGMEMSIMPLAGGVALRDLLKTAEGPAPQAIIEQWFSWLIATFLIGAALGGFVFGWLGDRIGRVRAMSLSILVYSLFTGACYFATHPLHIAILRFIASLGMGGEWSLGVALVMECWPENRRALMAMTIGASSNVGFFIIGLVGMVSTITQDSWRWVMLIGAVPALLTFFIRIFVPESARWKAAVETRTSHPIRELPSPQLRGRLFLGIALGSVALIGTWGSVQWIPQWIGKKLESQEYVKSDVAYIKAVFQAFSSAGAVVGCFLGGYLGYVIGRRKTYVGICLSAVASCCTLFLCFDSYTWGALLFTFLSGMTTSLMYGWLPLYLPELFPTRVRATGQGLSYNTGRILAAGGALGTGALVAFFGGDHSRAGATLSLVYLLGLIVIYFAPETKGQSLPD